ncbi:MAG: hypothetical protein ACE5JD_17450 [Candidatus Methylomirabilia bacterium]
MGEAFNQLFKLADPGPKPLDESLVLKLLGLQLENHLDKPGLGKLFKFLARHSCESWCNDGCDVLPRSAPTIAHAREKCKMGLENTSAGGV